MAVMVKRRPTLTPNSPRKRTAAQAAVKGSVQAAEFVVRGLQAIQADAYVVKAFLGDALGQRAVNQRAVGREAGVKAQFSRLGGDVKNIRPQQWLAPDRISAGTPKPFKSSITVKTSGRVSSPT